MITSFFRSPRFKRPSKRGMALVLVLSCLTLLSILVLAFLSSISTEVESSSSYANSSDVKQRSQTAINMVIAQIQDATSSSTISWSSQPGLIRTFTNAGAPNKSYKLYSSANMVGSSTFDPNTPNSEVPDNWKTRPSEYTDLNQPMLVSDPAGTFTKDGITYTPNYPILDPGSLGTIKGFSINNSVVPPNYTTTNPLTDNPAPMPVQWLYMLKDGSLRAIDSATGKITDASRTNPVVSRLAFWTDDDTCKININTAAGDEWSDTTNPGTFSDTPFAGTFDNTLKSTQPVNHEYQRYPGHPGTTYLSAVFPTLKRADIATIAPRINGGGSLGGTVVTWTSSTSFTAPLPLSDGMPLYASVDELRYVRSLTARNNQDTLFTPKQIEEAKFFLTAHSRAPEVNLFNQPRITMWPEPATTSQRTAFDRSIAFCSTLANQAFYFVRSASDSPTTDYTYQRNKDLYAYLQTVTSQNIPGFGGNFLAKYPAPTAGGGPLERDQILTEIFDYIRSSINLIDTTTGATPYAGTKTTGNSRNNPPGTGQVVPIQIGTGPTATRGFGNVQTIYNVNLRFEGLDTGVYNVATGVRATTKTGTDAQKNYKLITTKIQAILLINSFIVGQGVVRNIPNLVYEISGLDGLTVEGKSLGFPAKGAVEFNKMTNNNDYAMGGFSGAGCLLTQSSGTLKTLGASTLTGAGVSDPTVYPFFGTSVDLGNISSVSSLPGAEFKQPLSLKQSGTITLKIFVKDKTGNVDTGKPIQTFTLNFPDTTFPAPGVSNNIATGGNTITSANKTSQSLSPDGCMIAGGVFVGVGVTQSTVSRGLVPMASNVRGDLRLVSAKTTIGNDTFIPANGYYGKSTETPTSPTNAWGYRYLWPGWDAVALKDLPDNLTEGMLAGSDRNNAGGGYGGYPGNLVKEVTYNIHEGTYSQPQGGTAAFYPDPDQGRTLPMKMPNGTAMTNEALLTARDGTYKPGDWDNGIGGFVDGPYINKADEGETGASAYSSYNANMSVGSLFSPNRQVPSAVMFGSLSTGVSRSLPWQTLLFCPNPAAKELHPGWGTPVSGAAGPGAYPPYTLPPDHLLLDLFTMPIVEPYAISEPFSTAGKINMNYQIAPFTNIVRNTGLQAVLRSTRIGAIPTADGKLYHNSSTAPTTPYRLLIDIDATLKGFQERFTANQPFRSASEICETFLVPSGVTVGSSVSTTMKSWWDSYKLTGDSLRERPYSQLYSRLTTKSNTYTVHVRIQTLKKTLNNRPDEWVEGTDKVVGEYRGSYGIERYLDPNLTSYTLGTALTAYKFRTLTTKQFTP